MSPWTSLLLLTLAATLSAAPAPMEPAAMQVPPALLLRTSVPEPSGAVWSAALQRYLILSDDTGDKPGGTNHAPWVFTMTRAGALDAEPLPILGLAQLNDPEAICAGPGDSFFLSTSHSRDKKGRDKPERRRLLHLALSGRALRVLGALDLAQGLTDGRVVSGGVDIEALAYRGGDLYVGLKAPLTERGEAQLLRVRGILAVLAGGRALSAAVERYADLPLRVPGPEGMVSEGVSDMTFLPDGSLVLLANSPKGLPRDGGGSLFWLRPGAPPRLLRRFPGLKPEGVTLTEDGGGLLIVFDHDRQQPLWLRQPFPDGAVRGTSIK